MINKKTKKRITIITILWLLGIAGFSLVALDRNIEKKRFAKHDQEFNANLRKLDKMITGEADIRGLSEAVPDDSWQKEFDKYQKRNDTVRPLITSAATGSIALSGLLIIGWGISLLINSKAISIMRQESSLFSNSSHQSSGVINNPEQLVEKEPKGKHEIPIANEPIKGIAKVKEQAVTNILSNRSAYDFENINVMYCDEETANFTRRVNDNPTSNIDSRAIDKLEEKIRNTIISGYNEQASHVDKSLKAQSESLEKQVLELRQMTESVRDAASEKPAYTDESVLSDLSQQISAIREYASQQQNRNEKLQEGYDWNIVKNFCMRIIRCIDNIENRITKFTENNIDTADLEEIKDELIFSLESSGIEQFTPEINSTYSGQEKFAEVTKEKVPSNGKNVKGEIAEVIKPGYQYIIDDDNIRVVRTARIKLYE